MLYLLLNMQFYLYVALTLINLAWCAGKICFNDISNMDTSCNPDYYWRDFKGKIPRDAIEGGRTASGTPFYVAQAYIRNYELLPAMVFPDRPDAVTSAYNIELKTTTHVKVLCSKNKSNFKWVPIKSEDLSLLTNTHLVIGGNEVGQVLYIGRVFDETSTVLGKIFKHDQPNKGIWVPSQGHHANYLNYEVLTYVCPKNELIVDSA